jgi:hypothetical protein
MGALRTALHALRNVHDEQMRMWEPPSGSPVLPGQAGIQARRPAAAEPRQPDSWPGRQNKRDLPAVALSARAEVSGGTAGTAAAGAGGGSRRLRVAWLSG